MQKTQVLNRITVCLFLFIISLSPSLFGQQKSDKVTIQQGPETKTSKSFLSGVIGTDETGAYLLRRQKTTIYIEHLNNSMVVDKKVKLPKPKYQKFKTTFDEIRLIGEKLYLFSVAYDGSTFTYYHVYQIIDKTTLMPSASFKVLNKVTYPTRKTALRSGLRFGFPLQLSEDESQVMLTWTTPPKTDDDEEDATNAFHVRVLDENLNKIWEKDVKMPKTEGFTQQSVRIENNGDIYLLGIVYQDREASRLSRRSGKPNFSYRFFRFSQSGNDISNLEFALNDKFITDAKAVATPQGDILVTGFYSDKGTFSIKGIFNMLIDGKTQDIKHKVLSEFDSQFIMQYMTAREAKRAKKAEAKGEEQELYQYELNEVLITEGGSVTLVAEQSYWYEVCTTTTDAQGRVSTRCSYHYINNDILVMSFDPSGAMKWKCKIPKRQHTVNDGGYFSSYALAVVEDKLYFVYNDNPKNVLLPAGVAPELMNGRKGLAVMLVEVSSTGQVDREVLMTNERGDVVVRPKVCEQIGSRELLLYSERNMRLFQFSKVTFK